MRLLTALLVACLASAFAHADDSSPRVNGPSFDCAKATHPDEVVICANPELSRLDQAANSGYQFLRRIYSRERANSLTLPFLRARQACQSDADCIRAKQLATIQYFQSLGAPKESSPQNSQAPGSSSSAAATISSSSVNADCTGSFGDPLVRQASVQAVAELRGPQAATMIGLNESGARAAVVNRVGEIVYERRQVFAHNFTEQLRTTSLGTIDACLPGLSAFMADVRKMLEEKKRAADAAAIEAAKPENELYRAYRLYGFVKYCNEVRQGYVSVYINDVEIERAREKVEGIEKDALAAMNEKDFDTTALFNRAVKTNSGMSVNYQLCHYNFWELLKIRSSTGGIVIKKDF